jgi:hypothetical protein
MLSSTKPALRNTHGYFQLHPGTNTNHGTSCPKVPGLGEFSRTSVSSANATRVRRMVSPVRMRVPTGTVCKKGRKDTAGMIDDCSMGYRLSYRMVEVLPPCRLFGRLWTQR